MISEMTGPILARLAVAIAAAAGVEVERPRGRV